MIQTIQGFFSHKYNYYNALAGSYKVITVRATKSGRNLPLERKSLLLKTGDR